MVLELGLDLLNALQVRVLLDVLLLLIVLGKLVLELLLHGGEISLNTISEGIPTERTYDNAVDLLCLGGIGSDHFLHQLALLLNVPLGRGDLLLETLVVDKVHKGGSI